MERKPIAIAATEYNYLFIICNDGTIWKSIAGAGWERVDDIPQESR